MPDGHTKKQAQLQPPNYIKFPRDSIIIIITRITIMMMMMI